MENEAIDTTENLHIEEEQNNERETDKNSENELTKEDIKSFSINEELAAKQGNNVEIDSQSTPAMWIPFKSSEEE
uniref:Uncharacterized protein n=1 Tax=Arundo donax TaxID=35708 RepID=A0A0A9DAP7_ARUDO